MSEKQLIGKKLIDIADGNFYKNFIFEIDGKLVGFRVPKDKIQYKEYNKLEEV